MIDWISIVRHSRRRISGLSARSPVRIPRRPRKHQISSTPPAITSVNASSVEDCRVKDSPTVSTKSSQQTRRECRTQNQMNHPCCLSPYCINNQPIKVPIQKLKKNNNKLMLLQ
ncbi:hypothetical protein DOY81_012615 [Sarcophaga bullata]|nr:hypothetical protein DOY81_012615 [Sarcophaga bullata]